jgi:cobalt-zinc-cadmium efflux system protein
MPKSFDLAFAVGTLLNVGLVVTQVVYGIHAQSIALIADAGHNLGDALGLLLAWGAYVLARRSRPSDTHTAFVRHRSSPRS